MTGYESGGINPIGTRTALDVYAKRTIFERRLILVNGGKRGYLVEIDPRDIKAVLPVVDAKAVIPGLPLAKAPVFSADP